MKKFTVVIMTLALALSIAACGGEKGKTNDEPISSDNAPVSTDDASKPTETAAESPEATEEVSLTAKCDDCTITVPKLETFFDGYKGARVEYKNPSPNLTVYVNLYKDNPNLEVNVSVTQVRIGSLKTHDSKSYAEYYNAVSKKYHYEPVEIAGFTGYLATSSVSGSNTTENNYLIDYPLSDGSSVVLNLYVNQRYDEDTSEMIPIAEAFLKNIEVAPNKE